MKWFNDWLDERSPPKSPAAELVLTIVTFPIWGPLMLWLWLRAAPKPKP